MIGRSGFASRSLSVACRGAASQARLEVPCTAPSRSRRDEGTEERSCARGRYAAMRVSNRLRSSPRREKIVGCHRTGVQQPADNERTAVRYMSRVLQCFEAMHLYAKMSGLPRAAREAGVCAGQRAVPRRRVLGRQEVVDVGSAEITRAAIEAAEGSQSAANPAAPACKCGVHTRIRGEMKARSPSISHPQATVSCQ